MSIVRPPKTHTGYEDSRFWVGPCFAYLVFSALPVSLCPPMARWEGRIHENRDYGSYPRSEVSGGRDTFLKPPKEAK